MTDFLTDARAKLAEANLAVERIWPKQYCSVHVTILADGISLSCYVGGGIHPYISAPSLQEAFDGFMEKIAEYDPRLVGLTLGIVEAA